MVTTLFCGLATKPGVFVRWRTNTLVVMQILSTVIFRTASEDSTHQPNALWSVQLWASNIRVHNGRANVGAGINSESMVRQLDAIAMHLILVVG
jgi:hypothetical protein